jgi:hypothetical protein
VLDAAALLTGRLELAGAAVVAGTLVLGAVLVPGAVLVLGAVLVPGALPVDDAALLRAELLCGVLRVRVAVGLATGPFAGTTALLWVPGEVEPVAWFEAPGGRFAGGVRWDVGRRSRAPLTASAASSPAAGSRNAARPRRVR